MFQHADRIVQQLIDDPSSQLFQMRLLRLADVRQFVERAVEFLLGKPMIPAIQPVNQRPHLPLAMPGNEIVNMMADDFPGRIHRLDPLRLCRRNHLLKMIQIVQVNILQLFDRGLDIARQGDVDDENRFVSAWPQQFFKAGPGDDRFAGPGGGDDDIGRDEVLIEPVKRRRFTAKFFGQFDGFRGVAIAEQQLAEFQIGEVTQHEGRHFPRADVENGLVVEVIENPLGVVDRHARDAEPATADRGLGHHLLADGDGPLEQGIEQRAGRGHLTGDVVGFAHLPENLRLTQHHRIERRRDVEQMADRHAVRFGIEMLSELLRINTSQPGQKRQHFIR